MTGNGGGPMPLAKPAAGSRDQRKSSVSRPRLSNSLRRIPNGKTLVCRNGAGSDEAGPKGLLVREIARQLKCSRHAVTNILIRVPIRPVASKWNPSAARLSMEEREEIRAGLERGDNFTAIADLIGRVVSTVSREVAANGGRHGYRAWQAHRDASRRARRPKAPKLADPRLAAQVTEWLEEWWSPEEIAKRLHIEFPDDPMMWVSHETIYQSLFVQGRGELRRELHRCLRTGRAHRQSRGRLDHRGKIVDMVMISERPAEVEDRAVPGHWEGDLIIGKNGKSAVGTLVERTTRYVVLLHLPEGREAIKVSEAMKTAIAETAGRAHAKHHLGSGQESSPATPSSASTRG